MPHVVKHFLQPKDAYPKQNLNLTYKALNIIIFRNLQGAAQ